MEHAKKANVCKFRLRAPKSPQHHQDNTVANSDIPGSITFTTPTSISSDLKSPSKHLILNLATIKSREKTATSEGAAKKKNDGIFSTKEHPPPWEPRFELQSWEPSHGARSTAGARDLAAFAACGTTNGYGSTGSGEVREDWNGCSLGRNEDCPPKK